MKRLLFLVILTFLLIGCNTDSTENISTTPQPTATTQAGPSTMDMLGIKANMAKDKLMINSVNGSPVDAERIGEITHANGGGVEVYISDFREIYIAILDKTAEPIVLKVGTIPATTGEYPFYANGVCATIFVDGSSNVSNIRINPACDR